MDDYKNRFIEFTEFSELQELPDHWVVFINALVQLVTKLTFEAIDSPDFSDIEEQAAKDLIYREVVLSTSKHAAKMHNLNVAEIR